MVNPEVMNAIARARYTKSLGGPALAKAMMFANFSVEHVAITKSDVRKPNAAARRAAKIAAGKLKVVEGALVGA